MNVKQRFATSGTNIGRSSLNGPVKACVRLGTRRAFLALACAGLIFVQNAALVHALWHAAEPAPLLEHRLENSPERTSPGDLFDLCVVDGVLAQVLGGGPLAQHACTVEKGTNEAVVDLPDRSHPVDVLSASARGPPRLS